MKRPHLLILFLFLALLTLTHLAPRARALPSHSPLPPGFVSRTIATGLRLPVDMAFLPNGDLFVIQKGWGSGPDSVSHVMLVTGGGVQPLPVLELSTNAYWDSGLLAIAVDPQFAHNGRFYVWYATGQNAFRWNGQSMLRLSRFTYDFASRTAAPGSEWVLLEVGPWAHWHHGNALIFDQAGNLLVGIGELNVGLQAPDLTKWPGKIARIRPVANGYTIPPDNPYVGTGYLPEIYARGVRNPYRIAIRQSDGLTVFADVGAAEWEEINWLQPGRDYGWPEREGPCPNGLTQPCPAAPPYYTDPVVYWSHRPDNAGAVTGLAFYEGTQFPEEYHQKLFFADFARGFLAVTDVTSRQFSEFADHMPGIVDLEYRDEQLYILTITDGTIRALRYAGLHNQAPTARLTADRVQGAAPLAVTFTAVAEDADDPITAYRWDFGDGTPLVVTSSPTVAHTYTADGTYTAGLVAVDARGAESPLATLAIVVYSGEWPQIALDNLSGPRDLYHAGDRIRYHVLRSTTADLDPQRPYTWAIDLHHNTHAHTVIAGVVAPDGVLDIPADSHDNDWRLFYTFRLTMTTADGQPVTVERALHPALAELNLTAFPDGVQLLLNNANVQTPYNSPFVVGTHNTVIGRETVIDGGLYRVQNWSAGSSGVPGPQLHFTMPNRPIAVTAFYGYTQPAYQHYLPLALQSAP